MIDAASRQIDGSFDSGLSEFDSGGNVGDVDLGDAQIAEDLGGIADMALPSCDPPLSLNPESVFVAAYDLVNFRASGGTGSYRFALESNLSDAIINEFTGAYLAGAGVGQRDVVVLTDTECQGQTTAHVDVVFPLDIAPRAVTVDHNHRFQFESSGGSGQYQYILLSSQSGGEVSDDGVYTAGSESGQDSVRVIDVSTGLEADAVVTVARRPTITAEPSRLMMAMGSRSMVNVSGSSGYLVTESDEDIVRFDPDTSEVLGVGPGDTVLRISDRFSGLETEVVIAVANSLAAPLERIGRSTRSTAMLGPGDLNGDGYADAILGFSEASTARLADGIVAIYQGGENGLNPNPAQVLNGTSQESYFGRSVALGDLNGDGRPDLVVGAPLDDAGATNSGTIFTYLGQEDGVFEDTPHTVMPGARGNDQMGHSIAVCDLNGDGFMDVIGGAPYTEVRSRNDDLRDQGGILIFLGGPDGLSEAPTQLVDGFALTQENEWAPRSNLRLGLSIAVGDFDDDGLCDVAAGTTNWFAPVGRDSGMVQIFRGRLPSDDPEYPDPGGIEEQPSLIVVGNDENADRGALARRMAVADFNGDGMDDLVIAQHAHEAGNGSNAGAVRIFAGRPFGGTTQEYTSVDEADWTFLGSGGNNNYGISVATGQFDEDGVPDLFVGAWQGESAREDSIANTGIVAVFLGQEGEWPVSQPVIDLAGLNTGDRFGSAIAHLGDTNGDGQNELMVMASDNSDLGVRVGRPYAIDGGRTLVPLNLPGSAAGHVFGRSVAQVDLDGDGRTSVLVSAPRQPCAPSALNCGEVFVYDLPGPSVLHQNPDSSIAERPGQSAEDLFGIGVLGGDVTGNGITDVAVSAPNEEFSNGLVGDNGVRLGQCSSRRDAGAVAVYSGPSVSEPEALPHTVYFSMVDRSGSRILGLADVNGDGRQDIITGGPGHDNPNNSGVFEVYLGRPEGEVGTLTFVCESALIVRGDQNNGSLGTAGLGLGDINGDGCDDFVVGEPRKRVDGQGDAGAALLIFGWGRQGCFQNPRLAKFNAGRGEALFGSAFAAEFGADGGATRLFVGAPRHRRFDTNQRQGGVFAIPIDVLLDLPRVTTEEDNPPVHSLALGDDFEVVESGDNDSLFGTHVSFARGVLGVGAPDGRPNGDVRTGWVRLFHASNDRLEPVGEVIGDTARSNSGFGHRLSLSADPPRLVVGERNGGGNPAQGGSAYVFSLVDLMPQGGD